MLGNALPMRNEGLQSNMFYLQRIHFYITFYKNACHILVVSSLKAPKTPTFSVMLSESVLNNLFHRSASLVLGYNLLFVFLSESQKFRL